MNLKTEHLVETSLTSSNHGEASCDTKRVILVTSVIPQRLPDPSL